MIATAGGIKYIYGLLPNICRVLQYHSLLSTVLSYHHDPSKDTMLYARTLSRKVKGVATEVILQAYADRILVLIVHPFTYRDEHSETNEPS